MQTVSRQAIAQGLASSMMYVAAIQSFVSPRVVEQAMTVLVAHVAAAFERERQIDLAALVSQVRPANGTSLSLGASPDSRYIQLHRGLSSVNIGVIVSGATHHLDQIDGVLQQLEVTFGYRDNGRFQLPWVPCYWFNLNGRCPHGTGCTYLHAKPPNYGCYDSEGRIVCQYHQWYSRGCPYPDCQWSHRPAVRLHRNQPAPGSDNSPQQRSLDATLDEQAIVHSSFALVLGHFASSTGVASPAQLPDTTWLRTLCDQDDRTAATLLLAFLLDHLQIRQSLGEGNYRHAMLVRAPKQVASERHSHWPEGIESEMPLVAVLVHRLDIVRTCRSSMSRTEPHDPHLLYPHLPRAIAGCPLLVFSAGYMYDPQFMSVRINRADRPSPATYKRLLSPELARVCNRSVPLEAIQAARRDFYQRHRSNIVAVSCGAPSRFIQEGSSNEEAIVVYVLLRGFIPIGEQALPRTFEHNGHTYRVKVCDGCYEPWSDFRDKCGISIAAVPQSLNLPEFQVGTDLDHQWRCGTLGTLGTAEFDDVVLDVAITNQHVVRPQVQDADGQWVTDNRSRVPIQSPCPKDAAAALDKLKQQVAQCNRDLEDDSEDEAAKQDRDRYSQELQELQSMVASEESYTLLGWGTLSSMCHLCIYDSTLMISRSFGHSTNRAPRRLFRLWCRCWMYRADSRRKTTGGSRIPKDSKESHRHGEPI